MTPISIVRKIIPFLLMAIVIIGLAQPTTLAATEFMDAVMAGDAKKVAELIEQGADVNEKNEAGYSALQKAFENGYNDVVKLLLDANAVQGGITELMWAAGYGKTAVVKQLLDAKVNVNETDDIGYTALMLAIDTGHTEVVKLLLAAKADVNAKDKNGWTPLMSAADEGRTDVVKLLARRQVRCQCQE